LLFRDLTPGRGATVYIIDVQSIIRRATFSRTLARNLYQVDGSKLVDMN
jgi:hypothetical protein